MAEYWHGYSGHMLLAIRRFIDWSFDWRYARRIGDAVPEVYPPLADLRALSDHDLQACRGAGKKAVAAMKIIRDEWPDSEVYRVLRGWLEPAHTSRWREHAEMVAGVY